MSHLFTFEKLLVWQKSKDLAVKLYRTTQNFPVEERYGLTSQIRRAGVSIPSNLAEGSARQTQKDRAHFTTLSFGSLMESANQVVIAHELDYIELDKYMEIRGDMEELSRMLTAFRNGQLK